MTVILTPCLYLISCFIWANVCFGKECLLSGTEYRCHQMQLTSVPQIPKQSVNTLKLSKNNLKNLAGNVFIKWSNLTTLDLQNNHISTIDKEAFRGLSHLKYLDLSTNPFTNISREVFSPLHALIDLRISSSKLAHIPILQNSPSLRKLHLSSNKINSSAFPESYESSKLLQTIVLSENPIRALHADDLKAFTGGKVTTFQLRSSSELEIIDAGFFSPIRHTLENIHLDRNMLNSTTIYDMLRGLTGATHLKQLSLSYLNLKELWNDYFRPIQLSAITLLNLQGNPLVNITSGAFNHFENLRQLDLSKCEIEDSAIMLAQLKQLKILYLQGNKFVRVPRFLPSTLQYVNLANNQIRQIQVGTFSELSSLKTLHLERNFLHHIDASLEVFRGLRSLTYLSLQNNEFATIPNRFFEPLRLLQNLDLSKQRGRLAELLPESFIGLGNLLRLDLSGNSLGPLFSAPDTTLVQRILSPLSRLRVLDVTSNTITWLHDSVFDDLTKLEYLNLSSNQLTGFSSNLFSKLLLLRELKLDFNQLANLVTSQKKCSVDCNNSLLPLMNRQKFVFSADENPADCSCESLPEWWNALNNSMWHYEKKPRVHCETPVQWQTEPLLSLTKVISDCAKHSQSSSHQAKLRPRLPSNTISTRSPDPTLIAQQFHQPKHGLQATLIPIIFGLMLLIAGLLSLANHRSRRFIFTKIRRLFSTRRTPGVYYINTPNAQVMEMKDAKSVKQSTFYSPLKCMWKTSGSREPLSPKKTKTISTCEINETTSFKDEYDGILELLDDIIPDVSSNRVSHPPCGNNANNCQLPNNAGAATVLLSSDDVALSSRGSVSVPQPQPDNGSSNPFFEINQVVWDITVIMSSSPTSLFSDHFKSSVDLCSLVMADIQKRAPDLIIKQTEAFSFDLAKHSTITLFFFCPSEKVPCHDPQWIQVEESCFFIDFETQGLSFYRFTEKDTNKQFISDEYELSRTIRNYIFES